MKKGDCIVRILDSKTKAYEYLGKRVVDRVTPQKGQVVTDVGLRFYISKADNAFKSDIWYLYDEAVKAEETKMKLFANFIRRAYSFSHIFEEETRQELKAKFNNFTDEEIAEFNKRFDNIVDYADNVMAGTKLDTDNNVQAFL